MSRTGTHQDGAVMVEFALVLPLLLLLVLGIFEFGRALNYWIDQTHLANVAARWAVVDTNPGPGATLQDSIRQQASTVELEEGVQICLSFPNGGSEEIGDPVKAEVKFDYDWMPYLGENLGLTTTTLTGAATMRLEQEPSEYPDDNDEECEAET